MPPQRAHKLHARRQILPHLVVCALLSVFLFLLSHNLVLLLSVGRFIQLPPGLVSFAAVSPRLIPARLPARAAHGTDEMKAGRDERG
jgi:hypothetical protein